MALPAHILDRLPAQLRRNSLIRDASSLLGDRADSPEALPEQLLQGELLPGAVVEFSLDGLGGFGTSLALAAVRRVQSEGRLAAFIDPSASLHAPGVVRAGVELSRLIVVEPSLEALGRVAVRMAESRLFGVVVIDTLGSPSMPFEIPGGAWTRVVRRLALAVEQTENSVLLLTDRSMPRALPLPVKRRIEISRVGKKQLVARIVRDRQGRMTGPLPVDLPHVA